MTIFQRSYWLGCPGFLQMGQIIELMQINLVCAEQRRYAMCMLYNNPLKMKSDTLSKDNCAFCSCVWCLGHLLNFLCAFQNSDKVIAL